MRETPPHLLVDPLVEQKERMDRSVLLLTRVENLRTKLAEVKASFSRVITEATEFDDKATLSILKRRGSHIFEDFYGPASPMLSRWNFTRFPDETERENLRRTVDDMLVALGVIEEDARLYGEGSWTPEQLFGEPEVTPAPRPRIHVGRLVLVVVGTAVAFAAIALGCLWVLNLPALSNSLKSQAYPGTTWSALLSSVVPTIVVAIFFAFEWRPIWRWIMGNRDERPGELLTL